MLVALGWSSVDGSDNGAVLTVPCTMETVYVGMKYHQTLGGFRKSKWYSWLSAVRCPAYVSQYLFTFSTSERYI